MRSRLIESCLISLGMLLLLTTIFWAPALFQGRTIFHGDFLSVALPQFDLEARALQGRADLVWSADIYGGHPLFAEGQGAFAHPFNLFTAALITPSLGPVYGANFFLWGCMLWGGIGVLGLCRSLGASPWASGFGALAVTFSTLWLSQLQNPTIYGTMAWVPWCLWGLEALLKNPRLSRAALFGTAAALVVLAGYPQGFHGALVYMAVSLTVEIAPRLRDWRSDTTRRLIASGGIAMLLCIGLSAVRWLPLLELVALSHRHDGVQMLKSAIPDYFYSRVSVLGSLLLCFVVSLLPAAGQSRRVMGHLAAVVVLLLLGTGGPVFDFVYAHNLLPGLHFFRIVFLYLTIAMIGLGVAAAFAVDGVSQWAARGRGRSALVVAVLLTVGWVVFWVGFERLPLFEYGAVLATVAAGALLVRFGRPALLPPMLLLALVVECLVLRVGSFPFAPAGIYDEPESVQTIQQQPGWRDYKTYADGFFAIYAMRPPFAEGLQQNVRSFSANLGAMANLMWDLPSLNAALALPLERRMLLQPEFEDEVRGKASAPPGLRLIDLLAVRFTALTDSVTTAGFRLFWHQPDQPGWIYENGAARPRFQFYQRHVSVDTPEQALATLQAQAEPVLVIENPGPDRRPEMADPATADPAARFDVLKARATRYRLHVSAQAPVWLFLADANYPGWHAAIDGAAAPLFTAQILGKAVPVPAGEHDIDLRFDSASFCYGLWTTLATLAALAVLAMASALRRRARSAPAA